MKPTCTSAASVALAALLALTACGSDSETTPAAGGSSSAASAGSGSAASSDSRASDVMFAQMMIPHHQQAVEMADMALASTSVSAEVRGLAEDIKKAQDPEIATMRSWLQEWGAAEDPAGSDHAGHGTGMMSAEDMEKLKAAQGADFDRMWMTMMIDHHKGAITMAEDVLKTTQEARVKTMAEQIIEAQKKEIATMEGMLGA